MTYYKDVYKRRGSWWGATSKDQYTNIAIKYFEDYLLNSPNAATVTVNGVSASAAIHENKQDESLMSKYFLIGLGTTVVVGDLIYWLNEYWLVVQKEKRNFEAYNKVLAFRCNYQLKWIDSYGILNTTQCYLFGTMDSTIQNNFKVSNGIVITQPNKYLEIILPYQLINTNQRFIVRNEAWRVRGRDLISVDGLLYMYLEQDSLDAHDDNTTLSIADYENLNSGYIDIGLTTVNLEVGDSFKFNPVLYKNDKVVDTATFTYTVSTGSSFVTLASSTITAVGLGVSTIVVSAVEQSELTTSCTINVVASATAPKVLQIVGDDKIKCGRIRTYTVFYHSGGTPAEIAATFTLINNSTNLVAFDVIAATECSLLANAGGVPGTITLRATTAQGVVDKIINVVSVW